MPKTYGLYKSGTRLLAGHQAFDEITHDAGLGTVERQPQQEFAEQRRLDRLKRDAARRCN
jgi:hypothetical protein